MHAVPADDDHVQNSKLQGMPRKKGVRKKKNQKLIKPLPKMRIVVKSTKTISFDEHSDEDDSSDHNDESESNQDGPAVQHEGSRDLGARTP